MMKRNAAVKFSNEYTSFLINNMQSSNSYFNDKVSIILAF